LWKAIIVAAEHGKASNQDNYMESKELMKQIKTSKIRKAIFVSTELGKASNQEHYMKSKELRKVRN
jgi:hypothetical protein